jgi:hypothetical protein
MNFFRRKPPSEPPEFRALLDQSMEELRLKTAAHDGMWHLGEASWSVKQDEGTIVFTSPNGLTAICPVQIIGTYNTEDSTWLWGWDHPSVVPTLRAHSQQIYDYGKAHGITRLTTRKLSCTEAEAWELTALACKLCEGQGAYRGPAGATLIFMTFGEVSLRATDASE